jgi:tetratricopeptide (TPR) repeat protein
LRIDLLFALRDEQVTNQLRATTEGMDDWPADQQAQVHNAVATKFQQLNQPEDAELAFKEAIRLAPTLLQYRLALFELARLKADDAAMREAQRGVLEVVKSESDPDYVLTEVKRLLINFASEQITTDELKRARTLLNDVIARRSNWPEAYIISGQLAIALEKDRALALQNLNLALEHGPTNLVALNLQIRLLAEQGNFAAARKVMDRVPEVHWTPLLDRVAAAVLQGVGENDAAFREGQRVADANPNDPRTQIWFAGIATSAEKFEAAEAAYKAAIASEPTNPDTWSALLNYYMLRKQAPEVEATLRQAQLSLDEEYTTLLTAQQHRLFGRYPQAESIFLSSYSDQLEDIGVAQRMADFYLTWGEYDRKQRDKAAPYLNRILRAGAEGKAPKNDPTVAWARRQAARLFSLSGDYQDSLNAEKLLARSVADGDATNEGEDMLVDILNRRGDPASRLRAITLLQQIKDKRGLQPNYELLLGEALAGIGDWSEAERHMQAAIARHPNDVALRVGLIEMYINRKDTARAESWLARLSGVPDGNKAVPQLRIRLAAAKGDMDEVRKQLVAITPNLQAPNDETLGLAYSVAMLAESIGDHEYALQLISFVAARQPGHELELAQFTAFYGPVDDGIRVLQQYFDMAKDDVLGQAIGMLRSRRSEAPEKLDEFVNQMVRRARSDDPEAARRMVAEAESFEIQEKYDEAIAAYNRLLARDDVPRFVRASALNNFAFLLAMQKKDLDKALAGVNEAIEILGPISDVLDTRALVHFHSGEPQKAVEDLQLAVKMNATASKYFHLAQALLAVGDRNGAVAAWKEAEDRGISIETTPVVEQEDLRQFMEKIGASAGPAT